MAPTESWHLIMEWVQVEEAEIDSLCKYVQGAFLASLTHYGFVTARSDIPYETNVENGFTDNLVLWKVSNAVTARAMFVKYREHTVRAANGHGFYNFKLWNDVFNRQMHDRVISNRVIALGGDITPEGIDRIFPRFTIDQDGIPINPLHPGRINDEGV